MGCWGAAEGECQKSGSGSTEVLNQHKNVGAVGTVFITIVSWLGDVFQVLGCLFVTPVTLDKSFCSVQVSLFAVCGEVSLSGPLCAVLKSSFSRNCSERNGWISSGRRRTGKVSGRGFLIGGIWVV